jgi:hypothetical protein
MLTGSGMLQGLPPPRIAPGFLMNAIHFIRSLIGKSRDLMKQWHFGFLILGRTEVRVLSS